MLNRRSAEALSACLDHDDVSQLPPRYARVLGSRNLSALRSEQRAARAAARQRHGEVISSGDELVGRIFYAVLTTSRNHATRCMTIKRTWGARLPRDHLVFYSDKAETRLQQLNVVPLADPNLTQSAVYADAQDRFTYRIMPDVVRRMRALNMSWLLWADALLHLGVPLLRLGVWSGVLVALPVDGVARLVLADVDEAPGHGNDVDVRCRRQQGVQLRVAAEAKSIGVDRGIGGGGAAGGEGDGGCDGGDGAHGVFLEWVGGGPGVWQGHVRKGSRTT